LDDANVIERCQHCVSSLNKGASLGSDDNAPLPAALVESRTMAPVRRKR